MTLTSRREAVSVGDGTDIAKARLKLESLQGREYWRSLEELLDTEDFREHLHREFRVPIDSRCGPAAASDAHGRVASRSRA